MATGLEELDIPNHVYRNLLRAGIDRVDILVAMSDGELLGILQAGDEMPTEIREKLARCLTTPPLRHSIPRQSSASTPSPVSKVRGEVEAYVEDLGLPTRARNALRRTGITTIEQLQQLSDIELLCIRNIGPGSLRHIRSALHTWMASNSHGKTPAADTRNPASIATRSSLMREEAFGDKSNVLERVSRPSPRTARHDPGVQRAEAGLPTHTPASVEEKQDPPETLADLVDAWLAQINDRGRRAVCAYYGLGCDKQTLASIGDEIGLTRERVRQIVGKAVQALAHYQPGKGLKPYVESITRLLEIKGGLLSRDDMDEVEVAIAFGDLDPSTACRLIADADPNLKWLRGLALLGLCSEPLGQIKSIRRKLRELVANAPDSSLASDIVSAFCDSRFYRTNCDGASEAFIRACLRTDPEITLVDGTPALMHGGYSPMVLRIIEALRKIGEPAHYSAISRLVNMGLPRGQWMSAHNVHAILLRMSEVFSRVGRGLFGLAEWGLPNDGSVANAVHRVLAEASHPMHIDEIERRVSETWHVAPTTVYMAIVKDPRFERVAKAIYALADRGEGTNARCISS